MRTWTGVRITREVVRRDGDAVLTRTTEETLDNGTVAEHVMDLVLNRDNTKVMYTPTNDVMVVQREYVTYDLAFGPHDEVTYVTIVPVTMEIGD